MEIRPRIRRLVVPLALAAALFAATLFATPCALAAQETGPPAAEIARAVESVEGLNLLRERLATTFLEGSAETVDERTFREVCRPVGRQAAAMAEQHGWTVEQLAVRWRNPAHRPDAEARRAHRMMVRHPALRGFWTRDSLDGRAGVRYFRRITVRQACLTCHGAKDERPAFVRESYPDDRAHGFAPGDLRGVYSVFVPEP